jgi:glyoxylase-like metal-dependent hydrolase (beta-lactamase superfamily II)
MRLRYPNATHWVHQAQWRHAQNPTPKDRASFLDRDFARLRDSDHLRVVDGDAPPPPADGIRWLVSHGHTPGQLLPIFEDEQHPLLFVGDLIPTSTHLPPAWVMAYDLFPLQTIEEKQSVLHWCQSDGMMLAFPHDRRMGGARVDASGRRPTAVPIDL